ncbi:MAG TPA: hypothetical protein VNF45_10185 [Candidatus Binataceae bacterium]|nr:hypothetical protein [Candidatus Binataceae bacterium]
MAITYGPSWRKTFAQIDDHQIAIPDSGHHRVAPGLKKKHVGRVGVQVLAHPASPHREMVNDLIAADGRTRAALAHRLR